MIKFDTNKTEAKLIHRIVARAMVVAVNSLVDYTPQDCEMDVTACHRNGNPLDLKKLESFPDFDFTHDVFGIRRHLDRKTGRLKNCFSPRSSTTRRFARKVAA